MIKGCSYKDLNVPPQIEDRLDYRIEYFERRGEILRQLSAGMSMDEWYQKYGDVYRCVMDQCDLAHTESIAKNYTGTKEEFDQRKGQTKFTCRNDKKWDLVITDGIS